MEYRDGRSPCPRPRASASSVDRDKLAQYAELYRELGGYAYDRDPGRPDWYSSHARNATTPTRPSNRPRWREARADHGDVSLRDLVKVYGRQPAVRGVDLDIADREFVVFVGPSGCGKSTTLRMIAGLETISHGELLIGGRVVNDVPSRARGVAMVFQTYALYPHMTVRQNMSFGLRLAGLAEAGDRDARRARRRPCSSSAPTSTAGPPSSRAASASASPWAAPSCASREVFLFDEPLSNLDAKLRNQMRIEIKRLQRALDVTTIYVTHDQVEAMTLADRIVVMKDGADRPGRHAVRALRRPGRPVRRRLHRRAGDELLSRRAGRPRTATPSFARAPSTLPSSPAASTGLGRAAR